MQSLVTLISQLNLRRSAVILLMITCHLVCAIHQSWWLPRLMIQGFFPLVYPFFFRLDGSSAYICSMLTVSSRFFTYFSSSCQLPCQFFISFLVWQGRDLGSCEVGCKSERYHMQILFQISYSQNKYAKWPFWWGWALHALWWDSLWLCISHEGFAVGWHNYCLMDPCLRLFMEQICAT